jgi:monoterpene epsilon-lactone hydrolase
MASEQLAQAIEWERRLGHDTGNAPGPVEARDANERLLLERAGELPADVHVEHVDAGGVPAEWVDVAGGRADVPTVFFLHGGGLVLGSAAENRELLGRLTRLTGGRALAPDYRLAPEHVYPASLEDSHTAYRWLLARGHDPSSIVFMGESAGGLLTAALLPAARDAGDPLPAAAVLMSPLVDMTLSSESIDKQDGIDPLVSRAAVEGMMQAVLQGQDAAAASPINADLSGLPPLLIQAGTSEGIFDDGRRFAEKAKAAGVDVTFEPWDDMIHLWHGFPNLPEGIQATERIAEFIRQHTSG